MKGTSVEFKCEECGKKNKTPYSYYKRRKHHFCDRECGFKWVRKQNKKKKK